MNIRAATVADAAPITAIWNAEITDGISTFNAVPHTPDAVEAMLATREGQFFVAEKAGRILGFASYGPFRGGVGYKHTAEHSVYLAPGARGQGLGRALVRRLETAAKSDGIHALIAAIGGENQAAVAFHHKLGFEKVAHLPEVGHKFGRWMDLILMQKIL